MEGCFKEEEKCESEDDEWWHYMYSTCSCSLCRVELVVQFPARGSTQVLLCLFPGVLWLWHFRPVYSVGPHPVSSLHIYMYTFVVSRAFMAGAASQAGDADSSRAPGLTSGLQGLWMSTVVLHCWCHSDSASVLLYFILPWFALWILQPILLPRVYLIELRYSLIFYRFYCIEISKNYLGP